MLEHCDYVAQTTTTTEDGALRPDLVVRIPGGKHVVVDAKAPLTAYLDAFETSDEVARAGRFADHARQVREHVTKLSAKRYWRQFEPSPDLVIMFLPDESYLRVAHEHDPSLQEYAWSSNVILASPSTLMILLRTVAMTWQQETVAESAREVSALGRELYKRLGDDGHPLREARSLARRAPSTPTTRPSDRSSARSSCRRVGSSSTGSRAIEPPELQPIERQTRTLAAAELVEPGQQATLEAVSRGRRRRVTREHPTTPEAFPQECSACRGYPL